MIDYDALISAGLEDGASLEEIAAGISKALNEAKTKQEKKEEPSPREKILTHFENVFDKHYKDGHLNLSDVSAMLVLSVAQDTDEGLKMTADEIEDLYDFCCDYAANVMTNYKVIKRLENKKNELRSGIDAVSEVLQDFLRPSADRKGDTERKCACGKHEAKATCKNDEETIEEWLRKLFK